jgi:hypothetical protein
MNTEIKRLLKEIAFAGNKYLPEIQDKIDIVEEEGHKLIEQSKKMHNVKKKDFLWKEGDGIMENLTKAVTQ